MSRSDLLAGALLASFLLAGCATRPELPHGPAPHPVPMEEPGFQQDMEEAPEPAAPASSRLLPLPEGVDPADFDFEIHYTERVQYWLEFFHVRNRSRFATYLTRKGRYEELIRSELAARGMPQDLIYLALIESGFSPRAVSTASAVGIWQFIADTGRRYGLEVSHYVDERRDPARSTDAALRYLADLHRRFGSWYLAAAGYNTGENRVERLLREHAGGARGEDSLFFTIAPRLPRETRDYVPMMIAATILGKYPERFGFGDVRPEPPETFDLASIPDATDLDVLAELAGTTTAEIERLNPHFIRGTTPPGRQVQIRVPAGTAMAFSAAYAALPPAQRRRTREHVVARGETLSGIASRYGTTTAELQRANAITRPNTILIGQRITIPGAGQAVAAAAAPAPAAAAPPLLATANPAPGPSGPAPAGGPAAAASAATALKASPAATGEVHIVRAGETLWSIARRHGASVDQLRQWNTLAADAPIRPGQRLQLQPPPPPRVLYTVRSGDTLSAIARRHGVATRDLLDWNGLRPDAIIRPGDALEIRLAP
jgi:membrane-bound lytic murein transglycosylase D